MILNYIRPRIKYFHRLVGRVSGAKSKTAFVRRVTSQRYLISSIVTSSFSLLMINSENSKEVPTLRRIGGRGLPGV